MNSKKKCLAQLAKKMINDQGSNSGQNINLIAQNSGYNKYNVLQMDPSCVAKEITYSSAPKESTWRIGFLKELINVRDGNLNVGGLNDDEGFSQKEIEDLIYIVATQ